MGIIRLSRHLKMSAYDSEKLPENPTAIIILLPARNSTFLMTQKKLVSLKF